MFLVVAESPSIIAFVVIGFLLSLVLAFGVGANDVANFFGTAVGTNTLKLYQAFIIAAVFEMTGAVLLGYKVSTTVRKGIIDIELVNYAYANSTTCLRPEFDFNKTTSILPSYNSTAYRNCPDMILFSFAIGSLVGSAVWLIVASFARMPVSTTHSIVGSTLGAGLVTLSGRGIVAVKLGSIFASWVISPLLSGVISAALYYLLWRFVLNHAHSYSRILKISPFIYFFTVSLNVFAITFNGSELLGLDKLKPWMIVLISFGSGTLVFILAYVLINPFVKKYVHKKLLKNSESYRKNGKIEILIDDPEAMAKYNQTSEKEQIIYYVSKEQSTEDSDKNAKKDSDMNILSDDACRGCIDPRTNLVFHFKQILMAAFGATVHGANDISNSISPLMTIWIVFKHSNNYIKFKPPLWILVYGTLGMICGLVILGKRVIKTVGKNLTKLSPASGFTIEFGSALTVLLATKISIPVSTTHCQIGSIIFVGIIKGGWKSVNLKVLVNIVISWVVTLPFAGLVGALVCFISRELVSKYVVHV